MYVDFFTLNIIYTIRRKNTFCGEEYLKVTNSESCIKIKILKGKINKLSDVITKLYKNSKSPSIFSVLRFITSNACF